MLQLIALLVSCIQSYNNYIIMFNTFIHRYLVVAETVAEVAPEAAPAEAAPVEAAAPAEEA
jgi:hypothetical protein